MHRLRDDTTLFRALFDASPDGLIVVAADGRIVLANPSAARLLGYTPEAMTGLAIEALVPEPLRMRHRSDREAYGRQPRPRPMGTQTELLARRQDGSEVLVEIALSPLVDHGQALVVAAIRDIAAYPRMKQALQRARYSEHLAQLGRLAVDARDPQALLQQVPRIAAQALSLDIARVFLLEADGTMFRVAAGVGEIGTEAVGDRVPNRADTPPGFVLRHGGPVIVADYAREPRFEVPPAYAAAGVTSGLGVALSERGRMVGVLTVRAREARRFGDDEAHFLESLANLLASSLQRARSEEALNHAQRLDSVGQLTGGIAHDFNNLLTVIQGNLQVLEDRPGVADDPLARQLLGAAARATRRGAELTGKLLAFSRRQMLQPSAVDVGALLQSLADMLRRTLDQRIRIEVDVAAGCPPVLADPGQLEAALLNIAINARDAMPDGGLLRFQARAAAQRPEAARQHDGDAAAPDGTADVAIEISDTGHGMSEAVKERAFEPFFTTKDSGRGTGLGLSTVYGFVKQSHGAVTLHSEPGRGTRLTLYIPQPRQAMPAPADDGDRAAPVPAGLQVLLVEDDAEVRAVTQAFLQALPCRVQAVATAAQALQLLAGGEPVDLLISDIALGAGQRGTELARQAQQQRAGLAVLLISGYSAELLDADRLAPPDWELLRKPFSRQELAAAIARLVGGAGSAAADPAPGLTAAAPGSVPGSVGRTR